MRYTYSITYKKAGGKPLSNKKIKFNIPFPTVLYFSLLLLYDRSSFLALTLFSSFLHELGHAFAAKVLSVRIRSVTLYPFGADMMLDSTFISYNKEIVISLCGPLVNIVSAFAASKMISLGADVRSFLILTNLTLAFTNLLPISGLDGGTVLKSLLSLLFTENTSERIILSVSFVAVFFMWSLSLYIFFVRDGNPSLFFISCALFISVFQKESIGGNVRKSKNY